MTAKPFIDDDGTADQRVILVEGGGQAVSGAGYGEYGEIARRPLVHECPLFFFDCETGGLDATQHEMLEVACIVTDPSAARVLDWFSAKVRPEHPERIDPKAAAVNGYTAEAWEGAVGLDAVMPELMRRAQDAIFCAHNAPFDWAFYEAAMRPRGLRWQGPYHRCDTASLAFPLLQRGLIPNLKLATLVGYFGYEQRAAHTAGSDVGDCLRVFRRLMALWDRAMLDDEQADLERDRDVAAEHTAEARAEMAS